MNQRIQTTEAPQEPKSINLNLNPHREKFDICYKFLKERFGLKSMVAVVMFALADTYNRYNDETR